MEIEGLTLEELDTLQKKLEAIKKYKEQEKKKKETAIVVLTKTQENNYRRIELPFLDYLGFEVEKIRTVLIPQYPEWMTFNKSTAKPSQYYYAFDFEDGNITVQLLKNPKITGWYEDTLRSTLINHVGDYRYDHGQFIYPDSPEYFMNILKEFPENNINKYTLKFKARLVESITHFLVSVQERSFLENISLNTVDEYIKENGYPLGNPNGSFKNQKLGLIYTSKFMPFALLWEMGTGKTRTAIETFVYHSKQGNVTKCLVISPVSVMDNWENEISKWAENYSSVILRGTKEDKLEKLQEEYDFYIVSYESLQSLAEPMKDFVDINTMIIADESTKIKNPHAKRSKELIKLGKKTNYKLIMTGTPVTQNAYDLFSPFLFLDGGKTFGLSYEKFIDRYYLREGYSVRPKPNALENISNKMYYKGLRFLKKDCIDIPDKMYTSRIVELPEYNRKKYNEMVQYAITQIENSEKVTAAIILVQLLRLSQITSGFVKDELGNEVAFTENPKLEVLDEILDEINGEKVIIWCRFHWDVKQIMALLKKKDIKAVDIYGETSQEDRTKNVKAFQENPEVKAIVGTTGTGGLGINLTSGHFVIYYSNSYSLQDRLQSEDRTHRAGQTEKVQYIDILAKDTIDVGINKILRSKKNVADMVTKDNFRGII